MIDYYESRLKRKLRAITHKPHQPFFLLGISLAIWSVFVLLLALEGLLWIDMLGFHSINMSLFMTTPLFMGFLFTVLYRFLLVMPFLYVDYMRTFWFLIAAILLSQIGFLVSKELLVIGLLLFFGSQMSAISIFIDAYRRSSADDKRDSFWIITLFCTGALSTILYLFGFFVEILKDAALYLSFYLYAIGLVFAVAQKMVPNFFSIYFSVMLPQKNHILLPAVIFSLFLTALSRVFDLPAVLLAASILGATATLKIFFDNRFIFRKAPAILWVLQLASLLFLIGFAAGVAEALGYFWGGFSISPHLQIHIFAIGFLTIMIVGFGSRVAMGHSGRKIEADRLTTYIFLGFGALVFARALAVFFPDLLAPSAALWVALFLVWGIKYLPLLTSD